MTSLWFRTALLPDGWAENVRVVIREQIIARVEIGEAPRNDDERHEIAIPGLANVHSHAFQRGMAGLTEQAGPSHDSFWTWREIMYRFVQRIRPDEFEAIAAMAFCEMLETGFTRVGEFHYLHHSENGAPYADAGEMAARIAAAAMETRIGLTLLPVFYAHAGFGGAPPHESQRRFVNDIDQFAYLTEASRRAVSPLGDALVGVAPHSLRAVTEEELLKVAPLAGGAPVHIHVAEQEREVEECLAWSGLRPVEWLLDHAPVGENWCLVHATHIDDREMNRLAASGAVVGLCPVTEANLGDGLFPASQFLEAGGRFGIGTDSNVLISAPEELRTLEYGQRLFLRRRNVLAGERHGATGRALFEGALSGGAQALGVAPDALRQGASATFISLDACNAALDGQRGDAILNCLIFAARGPAVDCVWRRGEKVVAQGRHRSRDAIQARYHAALTRLID